MISPPRPRAATSAQREPRRRWSGAHVRVSGVEPDPTQHPKPVRVTMVAQRSLDGIRTIRPARASVNAGEEATRRCLTSAPRSHEARRVSSCQSRRRPGLSRAPRRSRSSDDIGEMNVFRTCRGRRRSSTSRASRKRHAVSRTGAGRTNSSDAAELEVGVTLGVEQRRASTGGAPFDHLEGRPEIEPRRGSQKQSRARLTWSLQASRNARAACQTPQGERWMEGRVLPYLVEPPCPGPRRHGIEISTWATATGP